MLKKDIVNLNIKQKEFFNSGKTYDITFRLENLIKLMQVIVENENRILETLYLDLHKSQIEAYTSEIDYVIKEIDYFTKNLKRLCKSQKVKTSFINQPARSYVLNEPLGNVLIISPWNYPFGLLFTPLVGAMAAGNNVILKPSEISSNTSKLINEIITQNFPNEYIAVVEGDANTTQMLINEYVDFIFFTGSTNVGKIIMKSAAEYLIPMTLELGGKNPCLVDFETDLKIAADRIAWGKFFNAGQTCIAPDYLLIHRKIQNEFLELLKLSIERLYPDSSKNKDYSHIINNQHYERLSNLLKEGKIIYGGICNAKEKYISPTIISEINYNSNSMQDEIFGPILPVLIYDNLEDEIKQFKNLPKPLAFYFFSNNKKKQQLIIENTRSGSLCINGTMHIILNNRLPFGGVGSSGFGRYHNRESFETFSNKKSIMNKKTWWDFKQIYPPYKTTLDALKKALRLIN